MAMAGKEGRTHPREEGGAKGVHEERCAARVGGIHRCRKTGQIRARRSRPESSREDGGEGIGRGGKGGFPGTGSSFPTSCCWVVSTVQQYNA